MSKCTFIMKIAVQNAGCVLAYFCGGHKNNFRLHFRSSFNFEINFLKNANAVQKTGVPVFS